MKRHTQLANYLLAAIAVIIMVVGLIHTIALIGSLTIVLFIVMGLIVAAMFGALFISIIKNAHKVPNRKL